MQTVKIPSDLLVGKSIKVPLIGRRLITTTPIKSVGYFDVLSGDTKYMKRRIFIFSEQSYLFEEEAMEVVDE